MRTRHQFLLAWGLATVGLIAVVLVLHYWPMMHHDVSRDPQHAVWVGRRCTVVKGLLAYGFTSDLSRMDITEGVVVRPALDGVDVTSANRAQAPMGPEDTFLVPVPKGTTIIVTAVRECWTCPFDRIDYAVSIPEIPQLAGHKVFARPSAVAPEQAQCVIGP